jgi:hypothetical protein
MKSLTFHLDTMTKISDNFDNSYKSNQGLFGPEISLQNSVIAIKPVGRRISVSLFVYARKITEKTSQYRRVQGRRVIRNIFSSIFPSDRFGADKSLFGENFRVAKFRFVARLPRSFVTLRFTRVFEKAKKRRTFFAARRYVAVFQFALHQLKDFPIGNFATRSFEYELHGKMLP